MELFANQGLKFLGIEKRVKEIGPTELVNLEMTNLNMNYNFLMEDDTYFHFEFQSTDKGVADLRRFRAYEALYSYKTGKDVFTLCDLHKPYYSAEANIGNRVHSILD